MIRLASFLALTIFTAAPALDARAITIDDYVGDWEMQITNSGSTFRSCALVLEKEGRGLRGEMVWRWGSVWHFDDPKVATVDDQGRLLIARSDLDWAGPLTLRRIGDELEGEVKLKNGKSFLVVARRGREVVNAAGTWDVKLHFPNDATMNGTLALTSRGGNRLTAKAWDADGSEVDIEDVRLLGRKLILRFRTAQGEVARLAAEVRGDSLAGTLEIPDNDALKVSATRRRRWGEPVLLIRPEGLDGWRPRNFAPKKFGWSCEDGVLSNGDDGDIDIQSEAVFGDFRLHIEYKVVTRGNSGVYLRGQYEVQILDDYEAKKTQSHGNGAVYSRIKPEKFASRAADTWQTYDITLIGQYLTVVLNGVTVVDNRRLEGITGGAIRPWKSEPGPLLLQGDHGKIRFRNVTVTPVLSD